MEDQQRVGRISTTLSDSHNLKKGQHNLKKGQHNLKKGQTNWYTRVDVFYNVLQEKPKIHYKLYIWTSLWHQIPRECTATFTRPYGKVDFTENPNEVTQVWDPLSDNQTMSRDLWQLPFAVAAARVTLFTIHRASEGIIKC